MFPSSIYIYIYIYTQTHKHTQTQTHKQTKIVLFSFLYRGCYSNYSRIDLHPTSVTPTTPSTVTGAVPLVSQVERKAGISIDGGTNT